MRTMLAGYLRRAAAPIILLVLLTASANVFAQRSDFDTLNLQVGQLFHAARYAEATAIAERAVNVAEAQFGSDHPKVGTALNNLAALYRVQGRLPEAEPLMQRALAIEEKARGPQHPSVGTLVNNLAELYRAQARYAEAEPLYKRALAIAEKAAGPNDRSVGIHLNNLALLYDTVGRYSDAEPLYKRALAIAENAPGHAGVGTALTNLAALYHAQSRYAEAEPLYRRALVVDEKELGPDHPTVAAHLNNLAALYRAQSRDAESEPLMQRALAIAEKALGPDHPDVGALLSNLATRYRVAGRYAEAEPLYKRALVIAEKRLGPGHPDVGRALNNLALLYDDQGRYAESEPLYKRALAIDEKALGSDHPDVGRDVNNLAWLYDTQGHHAEAEPLMKRALAIDEKALGPDHPDVGRDLNNLAVLYASQGDWADAATYWRRSTSVTIHRGQRGASAGQSPARTRKSESARLRWQFWGLVKAAHRLASPRDEASLSREMFQIAQWAQNSEAAESLAQMAARGASGDPRLAALVRERQDLIREWQKRDRLRSAAIAQAPDKRNRSAEADNTDRLAAIDARFASIDKELAVNFPDYAALASPAPLAVEAVQSQLGTDEALVLFLDTPEAKPAPEETFAWVVTKTEMRWVRSELGTARLIRDVSALRCGLDYQGAWTDSHCSDLLQIAYTREDHDALGKPLPFDVARAHDLYKGLFGQIEDLIKDKRLLIVPSGPLTQLPFHVLVTEPAKAELSRSTADYRDVAWLARRHAITVLPAVSSLKALRELAKASHASDAYIGFGNPLLDGQPARFPSHAERARLAREKRCESTPRVASLRDVPGGTQVLARGVDGLFDVAAIRRQVPLPETADELCEVANDLGVDPATHVYLGALATETEVKQLSASGKLARFTVVHFATHAALAGQMSRTAEPGLLLTPPDRASDTDDGYLTASEIAALKLDANWVILSACNTASGDAKGAEALSGLARAFFYAGTRSLLVSHWAVASEPTTRLITKAVAALRADPKVGRAEALRRAMVSMISSGNDEAHPAFWAPFVLVGEGGAGR